MSLRGLLNQTVVVLRAGVESTDEYGSAITGYGDPTAVRARLEQVTAEEVTSGADVQSADWRVYLAAGTQLSGRDRIEHEGVAYEVVGPPERQQGRRGEHHVVARLRVVEP